MSVRKIVLTLLGIAMVCGSVWIMTGILSTITLSQVVDTVHRTPATRLLACGLATAISFAGLAYYDRFATRLVVPDAVPAHRAWVVGAASHALSNTLGFHAVTGGALRYHFYRQEQVRAVDIAKITMVVGACVALGPLSLLAIVFSTAATPTFAAVRVVGIAVLGLLACAVYLSPGIARRFRSQPEASSAFKRTELILPLGVSLVEASAALCALYFLLPAGLAPGLVAFVMIVLSGSVLGVLSHSPGGVGVFEATVLSAFPADHRGDVLAALLLYRLIYNLMPFCVATAGLIRQQQRHPHRP